MIKGHICNYLLKSLIAEEIFDLINDEIKINFFNLIEIYNKLMEKIFSCSEKILDVAFFILLLPFSSSSTALRHLNQVFKSISYIQNEMQ